MNFPVFPLRRTALATALLSVAAPLWAADAATDLDQVVVTATRTAQTQDATLASVTVIDREDIERLQPLNLPDLLRGTPGLSMANNGGPGKQTSLFLRGTESDHVLVLIDGIKIGSATSGGASLQDIPVEQIERIEIVRGPFSSLYGSEALGGVIQIFTRRPQGAFAPHASASIGSWQTRRGTLGVGGKSDNGWYSINAASEDTDGINACRGKPSPGGAGCFTNSPDRDGYRNLSLTAQGGYRFNDAWDAEARVFRAEGRNEYDGSTNNQADTVQQVAGGRLRYAPSEHATLTLNLGRSSDLSDTYRNGVYSSTFNTRRKLGSLQGDFGLAGGLLSLGYDWQQDEIESSTVYARDHRINRGLFGQYQRHFGAHSLQASLRRDDDSQFGGQTTGSALWGWNLSEQLRLTASYGTAFKAPTFNELYFPGFGNAALKPEESRSFELGLRGEQDWGGWSLNAYETRVDELIAFDASIGLPGNIDRALIRGVEASVDTTLAGWDLRASATWLDPRNDSRGASRDKILPRRARESGRVDADRRFGRFSLGGSVYVAGQRYDDLANTRRLDGYATSDLRLGFRFNDAWSLQLAANNVFNQRFETASYYNQPGRNYLLTLRYRAAN